VQHAVTAWFVGTDAVAAEAQLEAVIDGSSPAAAPLADVKTAVTKLTADAARGVAGFQTEALVEFAGAQAAADAAIARSAVTRVNVALTGQAVSADVVAEVAALGSKLDELIGVLGGH
jgi:hypothetical protein